MASLHQGREYYANIAGKFSPLSEIDSVMSACFVSADLLVTGGVQGQLLLWDASGARGAFGKCIQVQGHEMSPC